MVLINLSLGQVVARVKSRDQLGKEGAKTLKQHFSNRFGEEEGPAYKQAQMNFARSLAGYAVVCYLLGIKVQQRTLRVCVRRAGCIRSLTLHYLTVSVLCLLLCLLVHMQDRHNGNILLDDEGHLIHIDFGFLLGISPGGNLGFENAAFKLSQEMVDLMGGDLQSDIFRIFEDLTVKGFLVARSVMGALMTIVSAMVDSGLPCFMHKEDNVHKMQQRFFPHCCDNEAAALMRGLVRDAACKWTTVAYDGIQKLQNNIYSDSWR